MGVYVLPPEGSGTADASPGLPWSTLRACRFASRPLPILEVEAGKSSGLATRRRPRPPIFHGPTAPDGWIAVHRCIDIGVCYGNVRGLHSTPPGRNVQSPHRWESLVCSRHCNRWARSSKHNRSSVYGRGRFRWTG